MPNGLKWPSPDNKETVTEEDFKLPLATNGKILSYTFGPFVSWLPGQRTELLLIHGQVYMGQEGLLCSLALLLFRALKATRPANK